MKHGLCQLRKKTCKRIRVPSADTVHHQAHRSQMLRRLGIKPVQAKVFSACFPCLWLFSLFRFVRLFSVLPSTPLGPKWHPKATVCSPMAASRPQNANKRYKDDTTNDETTKTTTQRTTKRQNDKTTNDQITEITKTHFGLPPSRCLATTRLDCRLLAAWRQPVWVAAFPLLGGNPFDRLRHRATTQHHSKP